jgi:hypothetical protein
VAKFDTSTETDNITVEVDQVLDKLLDDAIEAYGSSARVVYGAISFPALAKNRITRALLGQMYDDLRGTAMRLQQLEAGSTLSDTILSIQVTERPGNAHLPTSKTRDVRVTRTSLGFEVQFKSH